MELCISVVNNFFRILEGVGFSSPPFLLLQNEILLVSTKMQFAQLLKVNDPEPHCQRNKKVYNQIRRVFQNLHEESGCQQIKPLCATFKVIAQTISSRIKTLTKKYTING